MDNSQPINLVISQDGRRGFINTEALPFNHGSRVPVHFESGERLWIPVNFLKQREDGSYVLPLPLLEAERLWPFPGSENDGRIIPVTEERAVVRKRKVETGRVRITKHVTARNSEIEEPLVQETLQIERIPVNRPIGEPEPVRHEGDTLIIPVMEETLVVERRLVVKEELRITKHRTETRRPRRITLRREEVSVERVPPRTLPRKEAEESEITCE
jgi:uncharacterized protein (TIGR02271 family)